jgi:hypothetical protein
VFVSLFQKFGIGIGGDAMVPITVPAMYLGLAVTAALVTPIVDLGRLLLYIGFVAAAAISTALFADHYSIGSVGLLIVLYFPFVLSFQTSQSNYLRCLKFFSNLMLAVSGVTIAQHLIQLALSWTYWPNLDRLVPSNFLIPGFNYMQKIVWNSPYMKPNGIFFLEVSFLSQYLALALAAEIAIFQRTWRIVVFAAVILSTFAGTGLLLILLTLPVLLGRMSIKNVTFILIGLTVIGLIAYNLGWFDAVGHRMNEYRNHGSSADMRFVEPLNRLFDFIQSPSGLYSGIGAGQIEKGLNFQWWPITKAVLEYGLMTGALLYAFILYALFNRAPYRQLAFVLAVWFSLEGSLLTSVNPLTCALFSSLFVLDRSQRSRKSGRSTSSRDARAALGMA